MSLISKSRPMVPVNISSPRKFSSDDQLDRLVQNLQSPSDFIELYQQYDQLTIDRSALLNQLCSILRQSNEVHSKILVFILDCFLNDQSNFIKQFSDIQFKQDFLPFFKRTLVKSEDNDEILESILRFFIVLIEHRLDLLNSTLAEWLSTILHFMINRLTPISYVIYGHLIINVLEHIVQHFTPLPKEIVDVLGRSPSSIISTNFLNQLKSWIKHVDDSRLALFAIQLWQPLAALLSRLLTRGHTKGNEMLAVIQDAFIVASYAIRAAAFTAWSNFMSHIYRSDMQQHQDDFHQQQLSNRLLKLFLTPFLPDNTSKSKSASIAKCRAWLVLVAAYPTHIDDVLLPFFSFAFGSKSHGNHSWPECRQMASQYLQDVLLDPVSGRNLIKSSDERILNFLFDAIIDRWLDMTKHDEDASWSTIWKAYLTHLINLLASNDSINETKRKSIYHFLLIRIERCWQDRRIATRYLLHLLDMFQQLTFPLTLEAIETHFNDSNSIPG